MNKKAKKAVKIALSRGWTLVRDADFYTLQHPRAGNLIYVCPVSYIGPAKFKIKLHRIEVEVMRRRKNKGNPFPHLPLTSGDLRRARRRGVRCMLRDMGIG